MIRSLILIFGQVFIFRTIVFNKKNKTKHASYIRNVFVSLFFVFLIQFFIKSLTALWILLIIQIIFLIIVESLISLRYKTRFRKNIIVFLEKIIVKMNSGVSFQSALEIIYLDFPEEFSNKLKFLIDSTHFAKERLQRDSLSQEFVLHMRASHEEPYGSLNRLIVFLKKIKIEEKFRHKSGLIATQTRIQVVILTLLYLATCTFSIAQFGFYENKKIIVLSFIWFLAGLFIFFKIGLRKTWKI